MRQDVQSSSRVFGLLVSPDMKSALIKGTLNEGQLDYGKVFEDGIEKSLDDPEYLWNLRVRSTTSLNIFYVEDEIGAVAGADD